MHVPGKFDLPIFVKACTLASLPLLSSCNVPASQTEPVPPLQAVATLQEIMTAIIDPNIDYVWNSVSSVTTANGSEERKPQTDEDWLAIRQHALVVAEAANLLMLEDRPIASGKATTSIGGAELNPLAIKTLITEQRGEYLQRAQSLRTAAHGLLVAIDAKNVDELEKAGGEVERACEQCHSQFWYPGDQRPK